MAVDLGQVAEKDFVLSCESFCFSSKAVVEAVGGVAVVGGAYKAALTLSG